MPEVTPVSLEALAVTSVRAMIADSPTFIAQVEAYQPEVDEPVERIYLYEASKYEIEAVEDQAIELKDLRPFVVIGLSDDVTFTPVSPACSIVNLVNEGSVYVTIVDTARQFLNGSPLSDPYLDFLNFAYGICADMSTRFGGALDAVGFHTIRPVEPVMRSDHSKREEDDFFQVVFEFVYGGGRDGD